MLPITEGHFCEGARRGESLLRHAHVRTSPLQGKRRKKEEQRSVEMEILYPRCAGCDVHKKTVKVCLLIREADGQPHKEFRTYGTTTHELLE